MNKKKILTIALVVALIAIMVSGTLAYFTDTDEVTNTFTIGSVLIDIWENNEITDKPVIEIDEKLIPVVNAENPAQDESYIDKIIQVESNGHSISYGRMDQWLLPYYKADLESGNLKLLPLREARRIPNPKNYFPLAVFVGRSWRNFALVISK